MIRKTLLFPFALFSSFLIGLIRLYQKYISPLTSPTCRFHPTCSQYAIESIEKYGFFKGIWKSLGRLIRCHPFCEGGFDPP